MEAGSPDSRLVEFLIAAKHRTYAAGGSDSVYAVPALLPGSHQLEYASPDLLYRDVYFGEAHFAGQEVVYMNAIPVWSMCYAGGWTATLEPAEIERLAGILQAALRAVPAELPFRGPPTFGESPYVYVNHPQGDLRRFEGVETIQRGRAVLYRLVYTGGRLD